MSFFTKIFIEFTFMNNSGLVISNGSTIQMGENQTLQLNVKVTVNIGGVTSVIQNPIINYTSSDTTKATVDSNGLVTFHNIGNVNIAATLDLDNSATSNIAITLVAEPQDNYTVDVTSDGQVIEGITDIAVNSTKTFVATRKNNGFDVPNSQFDFEIIPGTTIVNKYSFTIVDDVSCNIKALGAIFFIKLRCHDRSNNELYIDKTIRLKNKGF
jgi:hypothetical protein